MLAAGGPVHVPRRGLGHGHDADTTVPEIRQKDGVEGGLGLRFLSIQERE